MARLGANIMNTIRKFGLASAGVIALCASSGASAANFLFNFQFDAVGHYAATSISYAGDSLSPSTLSYVSGDVNGATAPVANTMVNGGPNGQHIFGFKNVPPGAPVGTVVGMFFSVLGPLSAGQTFQTSSAGRMLVGAGGEGFMTYEYTTGRLTISEIATAVPEPGAWALLILGFGVVGGAMRARPRARAAVRFA